MPKDFKNLNQERTDAYRKSEQEESFLEGFNHYLLPREQEEYIECDIDHPFIFVIGLPRSGTTLLTQAIAHGLKLSYIDNITARFWEAPLHGMKLSETLIGKSPRPHFSSDYGSTESLSDIHEFGYFWRKWLLKESFDSIIHARSYEDKIDWEGLKEVLANMQAYKYSGFVFKNIFGSYHIKQLDQLLEKTLWIYIERDVLDVAISNLNARKKFYKDPGKWWSYVPPEYEKVKDLEAMPQIAGQLHYLKRFYYEELNHLKSRGNGLFITYEQLCSRPGDVMQSIQHKMQELYSYELEKTDSLPSSFPVNRYTDEAELKNEFELHLKEFQQNDPIPELQ